MYFLIFLGFTFSCHPVVEPGMIFARLNVNGKVISSTTKLPIKNIQVVLNEYDTILSDSNGNYSFSLITVPEDKVENVIDLNFNDIDSLQNGSFVNKKLKITTNNEDFENGDGKLYYGEKTLIQDVALDNK